MVPLDANKVAMAAFGHLVSHDAARFVYIKNRLRASFMVSLAILYSAEHLDYQKHLSHTACLVQANRWYDSTPH